MGVQKSDFGIYSPVPKVSGISKRTNVLDIIKKNKIEAKKEKTTKIYTLLGFTSVSIILLGTIVYF